MRWDPFCVRQCASIAPTLGYKIGNIVSESQGGMKYIETNTSADRDGQSVEAMNDITEKTVIMPIGTQ